MAHQKVEINLELESAHLDLITEIVGEFGFEDDSRSPKDLYLPR